MKQLAVTSFLDPLVGLLPIAAKTYIAGHSLKEQGVKELWENIGLNNREAFSRAYLRGRGLEIGGLNSPLPVSDHALVSYVDWATADELRDRHGNLEFRAPDIVDDGTTLASIADNSQDFVIACHVIEHVEDPIGAMQTWLRVLKQGGILFLSIPDRRFTFDLYRSVTTWEHLRIDHEEGPAGSRLAHFEEVFRKVWGIEDNEIIQFLLAELTQGDTHFHVWTQLEMLEMIVQLRHYGLDFEVEAFCSYGNEGTFVLRKGVRENDAEAVAFLKETQPAEKKRVLELWNNRTPQKVG